MKEEEKKQIWSKVLDTKLWQQIQEYKKIRELEDEAFERSRKINLPEMIKKLLGAGFSKKQICKELSLAPEEIPYYLSKLETQ